MLFSSTTLDFPTTDIGFFDSKAEVVAYAPIKNYHLHYEIHGTGKSTIVMVTGFVSSMGVWSSLLKYFLSKKEGKNQMYQCVLIDNRGFGRSTCGNFERYKTSEMAQDVIKVLEHANLDQYKSIHLIGMGGMISQEIAFQRPDLVKSLLILASNARFRLPTVKHALTPLSLFWPRITKKSQVNALLDMLFSDEKWLHSPDERDPTLKTNREILYKALLTQLNVNGYAPVQTFLGQLSAVLTHNMSPERLSQIGRKIGYVICVTGDDDKLIHHSATEYLAKHIGCEAVVLGKKGHALPKEAEFELIEVFERLIMATKKK